MTHKIYLRLVDSQRFNHDTEKSTRLVDDLCAAALNLTNGGPMGYTNFIQLRDEFKLHLQTVADSYRNVEIA